MNIKNKKTALDDSATLYQQNRDFSSKENLKNLSGKQKWRYFMDYYWKTLLAVLIILILAFQLLNTMVFNRSECHLSVIALNNCMIQRSEELSEHLKETLGIEGKNNYASIEYFNTEDPQMNMVFTTRIAASAADLILCSYEDFVSFSAQGMMANLAEFLPEDMMQTLSPHLLDAEIVETDIEGNEISREEAAPYGLDITGSTLYEEYGGIGETVILCIPVTAPNPENAIQTISCFLS